MRRWCVKIVTKVGERCKRCVSWVEVRLGIWEWEWEWASVGADAVPNESMR